MSGLTHKDKAWDEFCNTGWDKVPDQQVYVCLVDKENDSCVLFSAELCEANLVEVGRELRSYKLSEALPNWLESFFKERKQARAALKGANL